MLFTLIACALRTAALKLDFNAESGFFEKDGLITAASALILAAAIVALIYIFLGKPRGDIVPDFHNAATYIPSGLLALSLVFFAANAVFNSGLSASARPMSKLLVVLTAISALASIVCLLLNSLLGRRYSATRGAFALAPVIFLLVSAARLYFDTALPINAPNKNLEELAFVFAMLFFTGEARLSLGRERWVSYVSLGILASALTAYTSIPEILIYFINTSSGGETVISAHITTGVLLFALFIYITARSLLVSFLSSNKQGKLAAYIDGEAEEAQSTEETSDEYQISIDDLMVAEEENGSESN